MFLNDFKLLGKLRVADFAVVKISNGDAHPMFHFARAKIVQEWSPLLVFFEVFGDVFGKQNVTGIAAIHHTLRNIDSRSGNVRSIVEVSNHIDWAAMDSHPQSQLWILLHRARDLEGALCRRFGAIAKNQRDAVASW